MKILLLFSIAILFITGVSNAQETNTTLETSTVTEPTTTVTPTSSETPTPTTKLAPTTTVEPTTTVTPTTVSTTDATPTPTPTKEPTTSPSPATTTAAPGPKDCAWNITQKDVTCIRADLKMSFIVPIDGKNHQINLGCDAKSDLSDCSSNETQTLVLYEANYNLTMVFEKGESKFSVKDIVFGYSLPAGEGIVYNNSTKIFSVKTGNSYLCKTESSVHLDNVTMQISEIHVQAFLQKGDKNYGSAEECDADDKVSDVVPIAVGVALAALIIIVLIAYLVGRRRSRQKGYQSV